MESRFNLLGRYNDDRTGASAARTREAPFEKASFGEFKVPSLRNLILTAPYGRDGGVETLAEVVRHYAGLDPASLHAKDGKPAKPLNLTPREQTDLVVFPRIAEHVFQRVAPRRWRSVPLSAGLPL